MKSTALLCIAALSTPLATQATEQAFQPTAPGEIEVKQLPQSTLLVTGGEQSYFDGSSQLFRRLFQFIKENEVSMTTPVKADIDPGRMYFYVGGEDLDKHLVDAGAVQVIVEPQRTVMAIGVRGGYSQGNFVEARARLLERLATSTEWQRSGDAYAIYWNGPFVPGFLKKFEVHVPVQATNAATPGIAG